MSCELSAQSRAGRDSDDKGFEVDFLRRQVAQGDPHPFRFTADEDDLWPVQAERAAVLTSTPVFEHMIISATGRIVLMRTIDPAVFVSFKRWMASNAQNRPEAKRRRDVRQADVVDGLLREGLVQTRLPAGFINGPGHGGECRPT